MRRYLSVLLLSALLFNVLGYHLVYWGLHYRASAEMNERLDANIYSDDELFTIAIPITVPYQTDQQDYHRVKGSFEHKGEYFRLVKQKLERDTLFVWCIKDQNEKQLVKTMTAFAKLTNDVPSPIQQKLKLPGGFIKDYLPTEAISRKPSDTWFFVLNFISPTYNLLTSERPAFFQPPDLRS